MNLSQLFQSKQPRRASRHRFRSDVMQLEQRALMATLAGVANPNYTSSDGYDPAQLRHAYGVDQIKLTDATGNVVPGDGSGQTIAIIDAGSAPTIFQDLDVFDSQFGLYRQYGPAASFLTVLNQDGNAAPLPPTPTVKIDEIVGEITLDVEWAHAIAPGAKILLVEANLDKDGDPDGLSLSQAIKSAENVTGVSVVSMSFGGPESSAGDQIYDGDFTTPAKHFDQSGLPEGITFIASSGDNGIYGNDDTGKTINVLFPPASPSVLSVGGTTLPLDAQGDYPGVGTGPGNGEIGWSLGSYGPQQYYASSGGGVSTVQTEPPWQRGVVPPAISATHRAVPDVAWDADGNTGFAIYTSFISAHDVSPNSQDTQPLGWQPVPEGGTSAGAPQWAGLVAIIDQGLALNGHPALSSSNQVTGILPALYSIAINPKTKGDFNDITFGNNGPSPPYSASKGYDLVTGLGSPVANKLVPDLINTYLVNVQPVAIVASPQLAYTDPVATISFPNPSTTLPRHYMVTVNWGDGSSSTLDWNGGSSINAAMPLNIKQTTDGSFSVVGSHAYSALGFYTVTITLDDGNGYRVTRTIPTEVVTSALIWGHARPVFTNSTGTFNGAVATFTDDNPFEPLSNYTAVISWGDGTFSTSSEAEAISLARGAPWATARWASSTRARQLSKTPPASSPSWPRRTTGVEERIASW